MSRSPRRVFVNELIEVLEQFAYILAEESEPDDAFKPCDNAFEVRMTFSGPEAGTVSLMVPAELARVMAGNILGLDELSVKPGEAEDTAKELLNVFTGKLTFALYGPKVVTDLTVPRLTPVSREQCVTFCKGPETILLSAEGTILAARLTIEGGAA